MENDSHKFIVTHPVMKSKTTNQRVRANANANIQFCVYMTYYVHFIVHFWCLKLGPIFGTNYSVTTILSRKVQI